MTTTTTTDRYGEAAVRAAGTARQEPAWLLDRRAEAARAFAAIPMPTPMLRPWRYTDLAGLDLAQYALADAPLALAGAAPSESYLGTLAGAIAAHEDALRNALGSVVQDGEGKFTALNAALWSGGACIYAARGAEFSEPVVVTIDASALPDGTLIAPRLLIRADEQSAVTVVLRLRSGDADLLSAGVIEVVAEQSARVQVLIDDRWGARTRDITTLRSRIGRDALVNVATLAFGGLLVKQQAEALIEGAGGRSVIRAVALGDADQHFDFVTLQDHIGPRTESDVQIRAALAGASRSVYYGVTRVEETAKGANAEQANRNLLLSNHSKADSDPVLEILTADVIRCGHAAAVGPVDREQQFYLESRGLDRRAALQLLVAGFFRATVDDMSLPDVLDEMEAAVIAKLATADLA